MALGFAGSEDVIGSLPVAYRYEGNIFSGEKRSELLIVPAASVRISPDIAVIPTAAPTAPVAGPSREIRVTVVNNVKGVAESTVHLEIPQGWTATPADQAVKFAREEESQTVRFQVRPALNAAPGEYHVKAIASAGGSTNWGELRSRPTMLTATS